MKTKHKGNGLLSERSTEVVSVVLLSLGLVLTSVAAAVTIELPIRGTFEDGGTFSGHFTYRSDVPDREPSPLLDIFALERWDVTAVLGTGEQFVFRSDMPNPAEGIVGVDPTPAQVWLQLADLDAPTRPILQVVFEFLGPVPLIGEAPLPGDWGPFDPVYPGDLGIRSVLGQSDPGQPGPTRFVNVESANLTPQPMTAMLLAIGLVGLRFVRGHLGH